jgi:hypothetical protein
LDWVLQIDSQVSKTEKFIVDYSWEMKTDSRGIIIDDREIKIDGRWYKMASDVEDGTELSEFLHNLLIYHLI